MSVNNEWTGIGNLGADPEIRTLESGKKVANFQLATNEYVKGKDKPDTQWHTIVMWGPQAEFAEKYLQKGSELLVKGRLKYKTWEDKEGKKRNSTEIHVSSFKALRGAKKEQLPAEPEATDTGSGEDDLPF